MLLKGKTVEEDLVKIILAAVQLSEEEMAEGIEQIVPPSGEVIGECMTCSWLGL